MLHFLRGGGAVFDEYLVQGVTHIAGVPVDKLSKVYGHEGRRLPEKVSTCSVGVPHLRLP